MKYGENSIFTSENFKYFNGNTLHYYILISIIIDLKNIIIKSVIFPKV